MKGNRTAEEFGHPEVHARAGRPLRDATAINVTRWALYHALIATGLPMEVGSGGRTKHNRARLGLPKAHALDALRVGASTPGRIGGLDNMRTLIVRAAGRGRYQRTAVDASGFPRAQRTRRKQIAGFQTGDLVRAVVTRGRRAGTHVGAVVLRRSGYFSITNGGRRTVQGVSAKHCALLQRFDGYVYEWQPDSSVGR